MASLPNFLIGMVAILYGLYYVVSSIKEVGNKEINNYLAFNGIYGGIFAIILGLLLVLNFISFF